MAAAVTEATVPTASIFEVRIRRRQRESYPVELSEDGKTFRHSHVIPVNALQEALQNRTQASENYRQPFGAQLSSLLFGDQVRYAYLDAERSVKASSHETLHFRLRIDDTAAELQALPWEETRGLDDYLLTTTMRSPFARSSPTKGAALHPLRNAPIHIWIAFADPPGIESSHSTNPAETLDIEGAIEALRYNLEDFQRDGQVQVTLRPGPKPLRRTLLTQLQRAGFQVDQGVNSLANLVNSLTSRPYHIVHLIAPVSTASAETTASQLSATNSDDVITEFFYLESDQKEAERISDYTLLEHFRAIGADPARAPRLLLLPTAGIPPTTLSLRSTLPPLAAQLIQNGIPAVLSLSNQLSSTQYHDFLNIFYPSLLTDGLVDVAANQGRQKLVEQIGPDQTVPLPILWTSVQDGVLFAPIHERIPETKSSEQPEASPIDPTPPVSTQEKVNTGGGFYVKGNVNTGGDFVGRDKISKSVNNVSYPQIADTPITSSTTSPQATPETQALDETSKIVAQQAEPESSTGNAEQAQPTEQETERSEETANASAQGSPLTTATNGATQPAVSTQTPAPVAPPVVNNVTIAVDLAAYEPPKPSDTLTIKIFSKSVVLRYEGDEYSGPNLLDQPERWEELLAAQLEKERYGRLLFDSIIHDAISPGGALATTTLQGYGRALLATQDKLRILLELDANDPKLHEPQYFPSQLADHRHHECL